MCSSNFEMLGETVGFIGPQVNISLRFRKFHERIRSTWNKITKIRLYQTLSTICVCTHSLFSFLKLTHEVHATTTNHQVTRTHSFPSGLTPAVQRNKILDWRAAFLLLLLSSSILFIVCFHVVPRYLPKNCCTWKVCTKPLISLRWIRCAATVGLPLLWFSYSNQRSLGKHASVAKRRGRWTRNNWDGSKAHGVNGLHREKKSYANFN